jgi:hypothetical protein
MPVNSVVFFTTQTSASASIWRIMLHLQKHAERQGLPARGIRHLGHEVHVGSLPNDFNWGQLPFEDTVIHHNVIHLTNGVVQPAAMQFVVNFRDPRDVLCNQFYWTTYHQAFEESDDAFAERIKKVNEKGRDQWILERLPKDPSAPDVYYNKFLAAVDAIPASQRVIASYARVCLGFDSFVERVAKPFGVKLTAELWADLAPERPEGLADNPQWIGTQWVGGDTAPGRFKRELKPETLHALNANYGDVLRRMARLDPDYAEYYLDSIDV